MAIAAGSVAALAVLTSFALVGPLEASPFIPCSLPHAAQQITIAAMQYRIVGERIAAGLFSRRPMSLPQGVEVSSDVACV